MSLKKQEKPAFVSSITRAKLFLEFWHVSRKQLVNFSE